MASAALMQPVATRASMGAPGASPSSYHRSAPLPAVTLPPLTADASACAPAAAGLPTGRQPGQPAVLLLC